ncbi:MAG: hypothetical protein EA393_07010 [Bacteroidetes bacterium]|nr:MAG: hypothetical protein EA393_07010 [Bacteroidota bacterium]
MKKIFQKLFKPLIMIFSGTILMHGCLDKDFEAPDPFDIPIGEVHTIAELRQIFADGGNQPIRFTDDVTIFGVVTMDATSGNIFRSAFLQDNTAAINLRLTSPGGLYQGDSLRLNLRGTVLSSFENMLQIDSVHVGNNIAKIRTMVDFEPEVVNINTLLSNPAYQGRLVKLENVEFHANELGQTFADADNLLAQNRMLRDCDGNQIIVRTSGYANFADELLPEGNGSLVAVLAQFRDDMQLFIRSYEEIDMLNPRCDDTNGEIPDAVTFIDEDFQSYANHSVIDRFGWTAWAEEGERNWICRVFNEDNNHYAQATAFNSDDATNIMWMITPPIDLDAMTNPVFEFESAKAFYTHDGFSLHISENFDGTNVIDADWQTLDAILADQSHQDNTWIHSGIIDLSSYSGIIHIAWRYQGAEPQGETGTFRVDNVKLYENN